MGLIAQKYQINHNSSALQIQLNKEILLLKERQKQLSIQPSLEGN